MSMPKNSGHLSESHLLALMQAAVAQDHGPELGLYLEIAEKQGLSPWRLYGLATSGTPGWPKSYEHFQAALEMSQRRVTPDVPATPTSEPGRKPPETD